MNVRTLIAAALLVLPAMGQTPAELKNELQSKEQQAKQDPAALLQVAEWAKAQQLSSEHERLLQKVLKLDPSNEAAHRGLGHVQYQGEWMEREKAQQLEYKDKGWIKVAGVWVAKEDADAAKRGVYLHDGQVVSKDELMALRGGKVRHPKTGELIDQTDEDKAKQGLFPTPGGTWVDAAAANQLHANASKPWVVRSYYTTLISTLPIETLEEVKQNVDPAFEFALRILGNRQPSAAHRPTILVAANDEQYRKFGEAIGGPASAYGACLAMTIPDDLPLTTRPAMAVWDPNWGQYYVRYAAGVALCHGLLQDAGADAPAWFQSGIGGYAERFYTNTPWFAELYIARGGLQNLKPWFNSFAISGEKDFHGNSASIFQAGLIVSFGARSGDKDAQKAWTAIVAALDKGGKSVERAIDAYEKLVHKKEDALREHLQKVAKP